MADENRKINDELNEKELAAEEIKDVAGGFDAPSLIAPNKDLISPNAPIPASVADLGAQLGAAPFKGTDT